MKTVDIVFDGPPGPKAGRFIEVNDSDTGKSIRFGEWIERDDGYWALRVPVPGDQDERRPSPFQANAANIVAEWTGAQVEFLGASDEQVAWASGASDPNEVLEVGEYYDVEDVEVRPWHTNITLVGFGGKFNNASFKIVVPRLLQTQAD